MTNPDFVSLDTYHRRERILDTAADLFAEYGYHAVTTMQLADAAGCSESSLFKLFPTKEQIYDALFREWEIAIQETPVIPIQGGSALKTLQKFFNQYCSREVSLHPSMRPRLESAVYSRRTGGCRQKIHAILAKQPDITSRTLAPIFEYGQKNGEIREGDPLVLAKLFWNILWGELALWYSKDYQIPFQELQDIFAAKPSE